MATDSPLLRSDWPLLGTAGCRLPSVEWKVTPGAAGVTLRPRLDLNKVPADFPGRA